MNRAGLVIPTQSGWFAIAKSSGNLVVEEPIKSVFSLPTVKYSKSARNLTQATEDASLKLVNGGDKSSST